MALERYIPRDEQRSGEDMNQSTIFVEVIVEIMREGTVWKATHSWEKPKTQRQGPVTFPSFLWGR